MIFELVRLYTQSVTAFWTSFAGGGFLRMLLLWSLIYWIFCRPRRGRRRRWRRRMRYGMGWGGFGPWSWGCGCGCGCGCGGSQGCSCGCSGDGPCGCVSAEPEPCSHCGRACDCEREDDLGAEAPAEAHGDAQASHEGAHGDPGGAEAEGGNGIEESHDDDGGEAAQPA